MKLKSYLVRWLCLLLLVTAVVGVTVVDAAEPEVSTAATNGLVLENLTIFYPAKATQVELSACKELQNYLYKATGKKPAMSAEKAGNRNGIYVGATGFATKNKVTYTDNSGKGEGWVIKVVGNSVVITGGKTRGALYGVYHLLEDVVGVRWWNLWEEHVPSLTDAVIPANYHDSGEPIFVYRDIYFAENAQGLFHVRNRLNGFAGWTPAAYGGEANFTTPYHVHTFGRYFPSGTYFASHPEWYAWDADTQTRISDGQLCLSNDELLQEFTKKVLASIQSSYAAADRAGLPRPLYTDVSPDDRDGHCECDACMASKAVSGECGHLFKFVNKIAAEVAKVYPEIKVETLAYAQYLELPLDDTVPADNVVIRLAPNDMDIMHSLDHPNNARGKARMKAWADLLQPGQLIYWDYGMMTQRFNGTMPNFFRFASDYQDLYEAGGSGVFLENGSLNCAEMWDARAWIAAKIIEDPYQDVYEVAKDFATGYYGPAGGMDVYNYMVFAEEKAASYDKVTMFGNLTIDAQWLTAADVLQANRYFDDAVAKTKADTSITEAERQMYLDRINVARNALDRTILYNYNRFAYETAKNGQHFGLDKAEIGHRLIAALNWLDNQTAGEDLSGVQAVKRRGDYNSSAWYLLGRYGRFVGETDENGEMWWPEIPQQVLDDHPGVDPAHILDYPAGALSYNETYVTRVPNAASYEGGSALVLDQNYLLTTEAATNFLFSDTKHIVSNLDQKLRIGDPLIADGEYHLYRLRDVSLPYSGRAALNIMGSISITLEGIDQYYDNKKSDMYISMKIEGDPSGNDSNNYAKIYLDRIILVEDCDIYDITGTSGTTATCKPGVGNMGICPICGKAAEDTENKPAHTITGEYTYDAATGYHTAQCDVCGETVSHWFEGKLPEGLLSSLAEDGTGLEHVREYIFTDFELASLPTYARDSQSPIGKAIRINAWDNPNPSAFIGKSISVNAYPGGELGSIPAASLRANANKGYQVYKLSDCKLPTGNIGYSNYWWLFNWQLQSREMMHDLNEWGGKNVDIYVSMKIEGQFDNYSNSAAGPVYYLDRIFVVDRCSDYCDMENPTYIPATCTSNAAWEAVCAKCGNRHRNEEANTQLGHLPGNYVYNTNTGKFELLCSRAECGQALVSVDSYTVTFMNEGTVTTQPVMPGYPVAESAAPSKEGFTFLGWFTEDDVQFDFASAITSDLTLYAKYEAEVVEPEEIPYKFTTSMTASLELESEVFLNVAPQLTDLEGNALTAAEAQAVEGNVGMLIWDAATAPAEADATIDTCDNIILGATYNTSTKRFDVKSAGIAAKNLGDSLTIRAFYKEGDQVIYGKYVAGYSPKKYCYNQITKAAATKDVCIALLNYGAAAQVYFGHNTENMMNSELTAAQQTIAWTDDLVRSTWTVDAAKEGELTRQNPPVSSRAGTLELEGAINVVFTGGATGITVDKAQLLIWTEADFEANDVLTAENATEVVDMNLRSDGKYEYTYTGVPAKGMFDIIYACQMYTDAEGNVYYGGVLPFCAERYGFMNYNKSDAKVANLAKTMIVYGDAARDYFG